MTMILKKKKKKKKKIKIEIFYEKKNVKKRHFKR